MYALIMVSLSLSLSLSLADWEKKNKKFRGVYILCAIWYKSIKLEGKCEENEDQELIKV